jgi:hypothetical protein
MGDIYDGDQKQERNGSGKHQQRRPHIGHESVLKRLNTKLVAGAGLIRGSPSELLHRERKLRGGHLFRYAGAQTACDSEIPRVVGTHRIDLERDPNIGRCIKLGAESGTDDADNSVRLSAERDGLPDDRRVAREAALPQSVAQNGDAAGMRPIFRGCKRAPQNHRRAEETKISSGNVNGAHLFRVSAAGEVEADARVFVGGDIFERSGLKAQSVEACGRASGVGTVRCGQIELDNTGRVWIGERFEKDGINDRKDRRGGADPQSEYSDGGDGEARAA